MSKIETVLVSIARAAAPAAVMHFVCKAPGVPKREPTAEAIRAEIAKAGIADATGWRFVTEADLPDDREFRDAWRDRGAGKLEHDMPAARETHRARIRAARAPLLAALDVEYQRADERNDARAKANVAARKQALRDAPADPRIEAAETVDDLRKITLP